MRDAEIPEMPGEIGPELVALVRLDPLDESRGSRNRLSSGRPWVSFDPLYVEAVLYLKKVVAYSTSSSPCQGPW